MSDLHFRLMSFGMKLRDLLNPRRRVLEEVEITPGARLLDYGCGPGGYVADAAGLVGESGKVYALDIHPAAVESVNSLARRRGLSNVETILSGCETGLPDSSMDVVLFYDTYHSLGEPETVLAELHRVLKPGAALSFNDHHLDKEEAIRKMTAGGLFRFSQQGKWTHTFLKEEQSA
jgi:ubiquinone/menaquinone biosynthesis C-methylase UbiE